MDINYKTFVVGIMFKLMNGKQLTIGNYPSDYINIKTAVKFADDEIIRMIKIQ